ncbi:MAG: redoxin domain-containing protein [Pseudomonadota bacterium]
MRALMVVTALALAIPASANITAGQAARDFKLRDTDGNVVALSKYKGKTVVLEWNNPGCPFVKKHYASGNMQATQAAAKAQGAVWLTINSGAPGKQGHMSGAEAKAFVTAAKAVPTDYLLDPAGVVGKAYGAKTTPQIFVIRGNGQVAYQGAIDDKPTADPADIKAARNHVTAALGELRAGKPVSVAETRSYGCSVKYAD